MKETEQRQGESERGRGGGEVGEGQTYAVECHCVSQNVEEIKNGITDK